MSRTHRTRLAAFLAAAALIFWALFMRAGSSATSSGVGAGRGPAGAAGVVAGAGPGEAGRQGEFRRRNPFGIVRAHPPPAPTTPAATTRAAPPTLPPPQAAPPQKPLPLRLIGTIAGDPLGVAFLRHLASGDELTLSLGANLGGSLEKEWLGVVLTRVERKRVQFSRGPQEWILDLEEESGAPGPAAGPAALAYRPPTEAPEPPAPEVEGTRVLPRSEVEGQLKNLGFLVTQLNVQPYFQNGQPSGFRVSRIRPGSWVDKMGARNGDIIQSVNGKPITTIKDAFLLYNSFKTEPNVGISVLRNGQPTTMNFQIR